MEKVGLILEGGGMRGAYTAGVLDCFLDENLHFPYLVGASAGACNGSSYFAKQFERNYKVMVEYGDHPEYISYQRALKGKDLFGMDFIFNTLPNSLVPFDYDTFFQELNNRKFVVSTTDIETGLPAYFERFDDKYHILDALRASSSLPLIAPVVELQNKKLLDGGIADPIPLQASIEAGNTKHVVILTRNAGYAKKKQKFSWFFKRRYPEYPNLIKELEKRHERYNETMLHLDKLEKEGNVFIIRPQTEINVKRIERNRQKLHDLYTQGFQEAKKIKDELMAFLMNTNASQDLNEEKIKS